MKKISIGKGMVQVPEIGLGCMRISQLSIEEGAAFIQTALENGIDFFDHADIYGAGEAETFFASAVRAAGIPRDRLILQSKCGIRPGCCFDFSKEHILESVEGSLKRLNTEYLDILLLHRPDTLMEPEEVAEAFSILKASGKVRYFGVSNQNPAQIALLDRFLPEKILIDQLQLSVTNCGMIDSGLNVNMTQDLGIDRDGGILDYCRLNDITIQAWSPFQYGFFAGSFLGSPLYPDLNLLMEKLALQYGISSTALAIAWILRHPARIQPIVGTTNRRRLEEICQASNVRMTREDWYAIYLSAGKKLP